MSGVNIQRKEMGYFHSPTTFCEVTYDSDWMNLDDDRHLTPYRYSLMRNNDVETNSDTVSLTLPSYTYYEYLRSLYDCRTTPSRVPPPGYPPGSHISQQGRATTWHAFNKENGSEFSRQAVRSEPTRTRPTYPFPSLHLVQGGADSGDEYDDEYYYNDRTNEKLVWVDSLNKWVPQKQLQPRPYMSFVGNVPVIEKQGKCPKQLVGSSDDDFVAQTYERFEEQISKQTSDIPPTAPSTVPQGADKSALRERNNEKRETIRRRAQELAEQRRQRKSYSTPLYTSMNERKQNMKPRVQSSRTHSSLPATPIHRKDKVPSPKHVWQADEMAKLRTIHEPKPDPEPVKREISITLVSPQPDELEEEVDLEDLKDKGSEKKVTFTDQQTKTTGDKPSSSKKSKDDLANNEAEKEAKLQEQRLIESLEKQRLLQIQQQNKLLAEEEQRKENERKKKALLEEEEKLRKLKESHEKQRQPLSLNNNDNVYENTMNTAGKRRKGKGNATKSQPKPVKVEKVSKKSKKVEEEKFIEKLPITQPSELPPSPVEEIIKPKSPAQERRKSIIQQREITKKEKRDGRKCVKKDEEEIKPALPEPDIEPSKVESWIYGDEDYSEKLDDEKETVHVETEPLPSLSGDLNPELIEKEKKDKKEKRRKGVLANLLNTEKAAKKWRKPGQFDSSYADELRRLELAEERRKRQMEMFERLKNRKFNVLDDVGDDGTPRFEDYGFLAKYCIFTKGNIDMYRHAFEAVDEGNSGWLEGEDVMIALRGVNNKLTEAEEEYLYRVLELTGYKITHGADFKIFSVLAALSQRISALDKWMKNLIGKMDFKALEMKMFKCKTLWECNVDKETNSISIDQLCVDLRAGGVSFEHEMEVREKLAHLHSIDLLDFLTYIPLFIMIHEAVVKNPLSDVRDK